MKKNRSFFSAAIILCFLLVATALPTSIQAATAPTVPTNLTAAAASSSSIDLTWDTVDGATSYWVYRSQSSTTNFLKIATVTDVSYTNTGLCANTTYYYKIRAYNSSGTSTYTSAVSAKTSAPTGEPLTPTGLEATTLSSSQIELVWDPSTDAESYYVFRDTSASGSFTTKIATVKTTTYTSTGLTAGKRYYFKVQAYNSGFGTSSKSSYAYATTETAVPDVPDNLAATSVSSSQINLTWSSVSAATSYYVYRATSSSGTYSKIATVTDESYNNTGLTANTTYYYKIKSYNSYGTSDYSSYAYATTKSASSTGDTSNAYRLAGTDRYATAAKIAEDGWDSSYYAVIASGEGFSDALCGSPLAAKYDAPILLTSRYELNAQAKNELASLGVKQVFIIGGTGIISPSVEQAIKNLGISVTRIAGTDRYNTSLLVAEKIGTFDQAVVATGSNFPDALSIASIAGIKGYPILLTDKYSIQSNILSYLKSKVTTTIVVGGTGAISDSIYNKLPSPVRLNGDSRYTTNLSIIKYFASSLDFKNCYAATGENYPDALTGSALAAKNNAPVFLVSSSVSLSLLNYIKDQNISSFTAFGSSNVLSSSVLNSMVASVSGTSSKIPAIPDDLTAIASSPIEIDLDWDAVTDATGYYVYRATSSTGTYTKIDTVQTSSYTDDGLTAGKTYYYKVKAYNSYGESDYSTRAYDTTDADYALDTPSNLEATALNSKEIHLSWDDVDGASYYYIYRSTSSSDTYTKIKTVSTNSYTDTGLTAEKTYYYKIQAYGSDGLSAFSSVKYDKTDAVSVPATLTATALSSSQIKLTWETVSDAESYYIYRATSETGTYTKIATVTALEYTNTGLTSGKTYYYKIKAYNGSSLSDYSSVAEATTE
ncbi:cell wall-binding repeat-containing protein [Dehalobacter sp. TBBPA1]|uniref:cell wall-binding repeat-containing protein n=1 Tax=Dehalobacter sp. TBBPA1 TaxID=3235037 RepID=UPI0034A4A167